MSNLSLSQINNLVSAAIQADLGIDNISNWTVGQARAIACKLEQTNICIGILGCAALSNDIAELSRQVSTAAPGSRADFICRIAATGKIPLGTFPIQKIEYHFSRLSVLMIRSKLFKFKINWEQYERTAKTACFYPEYLSLDRRQRICQIALDHSQLGPNDPRQAVLFSLGGFFNYNAVNRQPITVGTTCLLFARGVLHAAGCNGISTSTIRSDCSVKSGEKDLPIEVQRAKIRDKSPMTFQPGVGSIFHIYGGNYLGTEIDSSHFGIIISPNGSTWQTVEGGQGPDGEHTARVTRQLIETCPNSGKFYFSGDMAQAERKRVVCGWIDPTMAAWMDGT